MRKVRSYLIGAVAGAALMLTGMVGGLALADVPDATPSVVDPTHTFYGCVGPNQTAYKSFYALDKSQGNCPSGWSEKHLAPVIIQGQ